MIRAVGASTRWARRNVAIALVVLTFAAYTLVTFGIYWARTLGGELQHFLLIGQMFGTPANLVAHGVRPTFYGPKQTGWDGQFYYYLSNDLFDKRHASAFFDTTAYRWQRIGFALFVGLIAMVLGLGWVSPETYLISYFFLVTAAVLAGGLLLKGLGASAWLILLWALCAGTQITLFNGLPDAAADSFLIISLYALFKKQVLISAIPLTFAVLAREAYVVFPIFILGALMLDQGWKAASASGTKAIKPRVVVALRDLLRLRSYYVYLVPIAAFLGWQLWVTNHFGIRPSKQAGGVVGPPFQAWWHYLSGGLQGHHPYLGNTRAAHLETGTLVCFSVVMVVVAVACVRTILRRQVAVSAEVRGFAAAVLALVCTYTCFGGTVVMHYSGYMKAAALFFFAIPFLVAAAKFNFKWKIPMNGLVLVCLLFSSYYHLSQRILVYPMPNFEYTHLDSIANAADEKCLGDYHAHVDVQAIKLREAPGLEKLFGGQDQALITVNLTNTSQQTMVSTTGKNPVFMSYEWVDAKGVTVKSGWRTAITTPILPGGSEQETLVVDIPHNQDPSSLILSPVQEGCAWYYQVNPASSVQLPLQSVENLS